MNDSINAPAMEDFFVPNSNNARQKPIKTTNNNMNSKVNKRLDRVPENLGPNGMTPSGKPRLFVCNTCTRAFARQEHLKRHERSHTKEKPFHCGVCQRKFSRRDLLLRHAQKLHAGCDDAIKRLRRRSSRSKSVTSEANDNGEEGDEEEEEDGIEANQDIKRIRLETHGFDHRNDENAAQEQHLFNHYLSNGLQFDNQTSASYNSLNSGSNSKDFKGRRTSFSAASAGNYASAASNQQNYSGSVEFSTPQLLPVDHLDGQSHYSLNHPSQNQSDNNTQERQERQQQNTHNNLNGWMTDINSIPGLDFLGNYSLEQSTSHQNQRTLPVLQAHAPNSHSPIVNNDPNYINNNNNQNNNRNSNNDNNTNDHNNAVSSNRRRSKSSRSQSNKKNDEFGENDIFGYSFYDDNYQLSSHMDHLHDHNTSADDRFTFPRLPSSYVNDNFSTDSTPDGRGNPGSTNSSLNSLNEYELLSELEVPNHEEKILSVGYSFYESNDFASSSNMPSALGYSRRDPSKRLSSPQVASDTLSNRYNQNRNNFNLGTIEEDEKKYELSETHLFTELLSFKISKALEEYPFVGLPPPKLPPLDKMALFVNNFRDKFSVHHPFIHKNYLNEKAMAEYTFNKETPNDYAPLVCLPLLIGTIGALYSNDRKSAADLYETSRRCIHVYLDSRKKSDDAERSTTHNSPLWLVQSLVLSVLYGLFAEYDESDLSIILRQVNALCTLIRVSKFNSARFNLENIEINEQYFKDYVLYQSKIRTVYMIFNVSNTLTALYNLAPFIKYKELKCDLPDLENYWECSNVDEFKVKCVENSSINYNLNLERIFNDLLMNNPINYKISEFGANIAMFTVLQHFYYAKDNRLLNYSSGISPQHSNSTNLISNFTWENILINKYPATSIMLKNITVIRSLLIDLSKIKEYLWFKKWDNLARGFVSLNCKDDDLKDACDYSIRTLIVMFINDKESSNYKRSLSLSFQFTFFNFFHIAKFLHKYERRIFKHFSREAFLNSNELSEIPKYFSVYLKVAKFLADLEQIFIKNFSYHDPQSKLALKDFDESRYNFGVFPRLSEIEYPKTVDLEQVLKVVKLKLSSNVLKIGAFVFKYTYEREMAFNIFKSLSEALTQIRLHVEAEPY